MPYFLTLFVFVFCCFRAPAQVYVLSPGKGMESPAIVLNQTSADSVIQVFGTDYKASFDGQFVSLFYPAKGLTFSYNAYDKTKRIRSLIAQAPCTAESKE